MFQAAVVCTRRIAIDSIFVCIVRYTCNFPLPWMISMHNEKKKIIHYNNSRQDSQFVFLSQAIYLLEAEA